MPIEAKAPPDVEENPYLPKGPKPNVFEQFRGVYTQATRAGVPDEFAYWIDGFFPIADRKARTMWGKGALLYNTNSTVVYFDFANIGATPYCIILLSNGQVDAVNTLTNAVTTILVAGTITNPSILNFGVSQWGSQYVLIVANQTNGYWAWDGTNVFTAGTLAPIVTMTNVGGGYSIPPIPVVLGGHGVGMSLTASLVGGQVVSVSIVNPGSGFIATDAVSLAFIGTPTGGSGASITASLATIPAGGTVGSGGGFSLAGLSIVSGGSLYNTPTLTFTSTNQVVSPAAIAVVASGTIVGTSITSRGLYNTSVSPTVLIVDTGVTASGIVSLMPFGVQGTDIEIYSGHVWIINGALVQFSAPGSFSNFATSAGGGNFTSNESKLRVGFTRVLSANGFLYLIGDSSTQYISGVQTTGSPPTTTFTNLLLDGEVGSPYPASVQTYGRNLMLANSVGIYVVAGSAAVKASEALDGVYNSVVNFGNLQLSATKATIFGKKVWMELVKIVDPISKVTENKLMIWDGKKWFASLQDVALTFVNAQEINSVLTAFGTDGHTIYPLFAQPSTGFTKRMQTKFWDAPGGYQFEKNASRLWAMGQIDGTVTASLKFSIESELAQNHPDANAPTYTLTSPNSGVFVTAPQAIAQVGKLTGFTLETNDGDTVFISAQMGENILSYSG